MTESLRDQLLSLGFKPAPRPERRPGGPRGQGRKGGPDAGKGARKGQGAQGAGPQGQRTPAEEAEIDLGKAWALRAEAEKRERLEAERRKQEEARQRREARARLEALLEGKALNHPEAEIARHFEYGGKIKRVYVTPEQLKALNAGQLGVVQLNGRYLLVDAGVLAQAEAIFPAAIALKVDPDAPAEDDPCADPRYQVPDDLIW